MVVKYIVKVLNVLIFSSFLFEKAYCLVIYLLCFKMDKLLSNFMEYCL